MSQKWTLDKKNKSTLRLIIEGVYTVNLFTFLLFISNYIIGTSLTIRLAPVFALIVILNDVWSNNDTYIDEETIKKAKRQHEQQEIDAKQKEIAEKKREIVAMKLSNARKATELKIRKATHLTDEEKVSFIAQLQNATTHEEINTITDKAKNHN